jgi:hypothetical protein
MRVNLYEVLTKIARCALILIFIFMTLLAVPRGVVYADKNAPPGESLPSEEDLAEKRADEGREEAAKRERARRAAEARRKAAEEAARKAVAAKEKKEREAREAEAARIAASEDIVNRNLLVGRNLVENGRYRSAVIVLSSFLNDHPDFAEAWYLLSRANHALGDYDKAQSAVSRALDIDPYYPELVKTPNGLQPMPILTKQQKKEPRPSMSVLPIKQPMPANLLLEPVVMSFPILVESEAYPNEEYGGSILEPGGGDPLVGAYLQYSPLIPDPLGSTVRWMQSEKFNEISRWRFRVDRMGILTDPRVPIAWKGSKPYEIYFWTGEEWARVRKKKTGRAASYEDTLYGARESMKEVLAARNFQWYEPDTPSLAASASLMRYKWMGDVDLIDAEIRAEIETGNNVRRSSSYIDVE